MRYSDETIEQVRDANDIVDVIGQYVRLTKKGANYFGLCPFHGEKTASFSVSPGKQIYYCFGCGKGGSVFNFIMEYENYSFTEAVKSLAERARIDLPAGGDDSASKINAEQRSRLLEMHKEAAIYYHKMLYSKEDDAGLRYFREKRQLPDKTITHFGLGYTGKKSDGLYRFLKQKGYSDEDLNASGLVVFEERGIHDRFWNRVMFPIMDVNNKVIGFGGRVLGDGLPKYLNSPETIIFNKSRNLYGLNFARKSKQDYMLLCEGYMDVIALQQAGFTNSVASLGTAFNEKHASLLKRYTNNVILTQDSDDAGIRAKLRAFPILKNAGLNVKVLVMDDCKDPDEYIKTKGIPAYESCIAKAKNAFLFETDVLKAGYDLSDPAMKTEFYNKLAEKLCMFTEPLERKNYTEAVCNTYLIPFNELTALVENRYIMSARSRQNGPKDYDPDKEYLNSLNRKTPVSAAASLRDDHFDHQNAAPAYAAADDEYWNALQAQADSSGAYDDPEGMQAGSSYASDNGSAAFDNDAATYTDEPAAERNGSAAYTGRGAAERNGNAAYTGRGAAERNGNAAYAGGAAGRNGNAAYAGGGTAQKNGRYGQNYGMQRSSAAEKRSRDKKESALLKSERLIISFLSEHPQLCGRVFAVLKTDYFSEGLYRDIAGMLASGVKADPAVIMEKYADDEESAALAGAIFSADTKYLNSDDISGKDQEKAINEAIRNVLNYRIDEEMAACADMKHFMELAARKKQIGSVKVEISLNNEV